jgi:transposase
LRQDKGALIADMPSRPIEQYVACNVLLNQILINKYVDHLPLYRQLQIFKRANKRCALLPGNLQIEAKTEGM